ncbi:unnamed protein product [Cuscuta europaea]|uniref:Uncharacterized protein n=1 Tax=Cuscuta europaea TaxID=41803 RepID=A0A9P0YP39_CUSEU|nr:unnamed protein product [Cuscuta europaea]
MPTSSTVPPTIAPVLPEIGGPSTAFSGLTFSSQPGVAPLSQVLPSSLQGFGNTPSFLSSLASQLAFSTPNVNNIVTTRLSAVEDYLS